MERIHWHCCRNNSYDEAFLAASLGELQGWLNSTISLDVQFSRLEANLIRALAPCLDDEFLSNSDYEDWYDALLKSLCDENRASAGQSVAGKLILYSPDKPALEAICRSQSEFDSWGLRQGFLVVIWEANNKHLIWHEVLHLLGADDCYDVESPLQRPECTHESQCLMQYVPTFENCGSTPILCEINRLRVIEAASL